MTHRPAEGGLTLVELLVVIFLLALLAQAAVLASEGLLEQTQRDTTVNTLRELETAVLGQAGRVDSQGRPYVGGFVADVGDLPHQWAGAPELALRELWERPVAPPRVLLPFTLQQAAGDPEVRLGCGWRGPYLRLGIGVAALRDGWANAFQVLDSAGQATNAGGAIAAIVSRGADGATGGVGYDLDLPFVVHATTAVPLGAPTAPRHLGAVPLQVQTLAGGGGVLVVRVYGPRDGALATIRQVLVTSFTPGLELSLAIPDVSIGPRVLRAYQVAAAPADADTPLGPVARSRVQPIVVEAFAIPTVVLAVQS